MRARRLVGLAAGASLFAIAACSAIAGLDGDFTVGDGGTGAASSSSGGDANVPGKDGSPNTTDATTDGGQPDNFVPPPDACGARTDTSPDATTAPAEVCADLPSGALACIDFSGSNDPPTLNDGLNSTAGTIEAQGLVGNAERHLHAFVDAAAPIDSGSAFWLYDWISGTRPQIDPLSVSKGMTLYFAFSFRLASAAQRPLVMAAVAIGDRQYGLEVYPDPCGGSSRVMQTGDDPTNISLGAPIQVGSWYRALVQIKRNGDNSWDGEGFLSGVSVGKRVAIFDGTLSTNVPAGIGLGLFNAGPPSGTADIWIDNVTFGPNAP